MSCLLIAGSALSVGIALGVFIMTAGQHRDP
jgi:hypothetical protein